MHNVEERLKELEITLPETAAPAANYLPFHVVGTTVYISGQLPKWEGKLLYAGRVGDDVSLEEGNKAARICALHLLAQLKAACGGDLQRVKCCAKLGGFVQCTPEFTQQPEVINGASDLLVEVFGDAGRHARFAVGTSALPRNTCVEIDAIFELHSGS